MAKFREYLNYGFWVGLVSIVISYLLSILKIPTLQFTFSTAPTIEFNVRQQLQSGVGTGIGDKVLGYITGIIPSSWTSLIAVFITSIAIVLFGVLLSNVIKRVADYEPGKQIY